MLGKVSYWVATGIASAISAFTVAAYLSGSQEVVQAFSHVGYPQQLRILLGVAKSLGVIALLVPGFPRLKEWAYAGFTFAWIAAFVAHYLVHDQETFMPLVLLGLLFVSYQTRPSNRRWLPRIPELSNPQRVLSVNSK